jgi:putative acetyltransferase
VTGPAAAIRAAGPSDAAAIRRVHERASGRPDEADLVAALAGDAELSLVAHDEEAGVVGHVLLCRASVSGRVPILALGPLAVLPAHRSRGHGRALVREALRRARDTTFPAVVVLGRPAAFFAKLGFEPARRLGLRAPSATAPEAWRAVRLPAWTDGVRGTVRYPPALAALAG